MEWANTRETTEPEDNAYCLLGILDVSMLTSYGEGKEMALSRLYNELEPDNTTLSNIPFSRNLRFVGREAQLALLEDQLFGDKQTTTIAITGAGGTGKSQLALELAYRTKEKHRSCSVFWIDASNPDSLYQAYSSIAQKLDIPGWDREQVDIQLLVKFHLSGKNARQWLLIFDNADNVQSAGLSTSQSVDLIDLLPQSEMGTTILTTSNSDAARKLANQNIVDLQEMTLNTAQRMLENYLDSPVQASEKKEILPLLQELSFLPLPIVQAAAYINNTNITLEDYRLQVVIEKNESSGLGSNMSEEKPQDSSTKNPATATTLISLHQLRRNSPLAADYLFLISCVNRKDVPLDFLGTASSFEREDTVGVLNAYALVTRRPAESSLDLHQMVYIAIRDWLHKQALLQEWTYRAIIRLHHVFPDSHEWGRSKWRRILPHAQHALFYDQTEQNDEIRTELALRCAMTLYSDGRYNESQELFVQVTETTKRVLGEEHPSALTSMANLASTYRNQGRWKEAEELFVQVTETRKRVLGEEHPSTLISIADVASTYRNQGRWREAEELFVQVTETTKRVLGEEHPSTLISIADVASTYRNQGRWKEAEELEVQVTETRKRVLGE